MSLFDGLPVTGQVSGLRVVQEINALDAEAHAILAAAGITPDATKADQLQAAIKQLAWGNQTDPLASKAEAEAGSENTKRMTPLRVAQAIAALASKGFMPKSVIDKLDKSTPCLIKTGAGTLSIKAGTTVYLESGSVYFAAQTAVTMPTLTAGTDYSVWARPDGSASAVADPFTAPASAPVAGALKIGGFHYGLVPSGTTVASGSFATTGAGMIWTQGDVDKIAGINAFSLWDLTYRPTCDPRGMACVQDSKGRGLFWFDLYFCSQTHITNGTSRYNTTVASGTVPPSIPLMFGGNGTTNYTSLTWYEANEIAFSHKKRLMSYQEFAAAAFGVTENQSIGGASSTIPATARQAGYTSRWGGEQMTGHHWSWGNVAHGASGSAWVSGPNRGQSYGTPFAALFGGARDNAGAPGSRCSGWYCAPWFSNWNVGLRAACDHLNL